jgi:hypothetical protein
LPIISQFGKPTQESYTAQRVTIIPTNNQQRFKEVQIKVPSRDGIPSERRSFQISPSSRHTVKEIVVCVSRGSSPEKQHHPPISPLHTFSDEGEEKRKRLLTVDVSQRKLDIFALFACHTNTDPFDIFCRLFDQHFFIDIVFFLQDIPSSSSYDDDFHHENTFPFWLH